MFCQRKFEKKEKKNTSENREIKPRTYFLKI